MRLYTGSRRAYLVRFGFFLAAGILVAAPSLSADSASFDPRAVALIERFAEAWKKTPGATFRVSKIERLRDGGERFERSFVKLKKPGMIYMAIEKPRAGTEALYVLARDPDKLIAHRGHFPDVTVKLDIHGGLALRDQHHPISHTDLQYTIDILRSALERARREPRGERLEYGGKGEVDGRPAKIVRLYGGNRPVELVRARRSEKLFDFAARVGMDAYVIFAANPKIHSLTSVLKEGESYAVPPYYGHKTEMVFDAATGLLLSQAIWNDQGELYERYDYSDMKPGAPLNDVDFDRKNPAYHF